MVPPVTPYDLNHLMLIQLISPPRNCPSLSLSWFKRLPVAVQTAFFTWVRLVFRYRTVQLSFAVVKQFPSKLSYLDPNQMPRRSFQFHSACGRTVLFWICDGKQRRGKSLSATLVFESNRQNVSVCYLASVKTSVTSSRTQLPSSAWLCVWVLLQVRSRTCGMLWTCWLERSSRPWPPPLLRCCVRPPLFSIWDAQVNQPCSPSAASPPN